MEEIPEQKILSKYAISHACHIKLPLAIFHKAHFIQ